MKQFFILGRNPELSKAEILSYLNAREIEFNQLLFEDNFLIIEYQNFKLNIQELGGTIMSGEIKFVGQKKQLLEFIQKDEIIPKDKFSFNILGNYNIEQELYNKFKSEKRKSRVRHGRGRINMQNGEEFSIPNADFHVFCHKLNLIYFGVVAQSYSYKDIKNRDMHKPIRREALAISPRLAKILINLSQARYKLLDPFCGVGGILQEALLKGINCYGIDKDKQAVLQAKKNLDWLNKNFKISASYNLNNIDARNAPNIQFDGIATEPNLGELFKRKPNNFEAQQVITQFENSIIPILQKLKNIKKPEAKIAITFPSIRNFSCNMKKILGMTGLIPVNLKDMTWPIREFRPDQFISRELWVFM